jgi:two-component sensor histidine kinase
VTWNVLNGPHPEKRLFLKWLEHGGAPATTTASPVRRGYGRELIERALPYQLNAKTTFELSDEGVRCAIDVPLEEFERGTRSDAAIAS